jgi:glycosyltransferase involved in cell wall biosynthesis
MRVLYVNHTAQVSGAEEALLDLVRALPSDVEALVAAPAGPLSERLRALGIEVLPIAATDGSLRLHPVYTPRALVQLARAGTAIARQAKRVRADAIHANSIRAGLSATLARVAGAAPPLVHVHDCLPPGRISDLTRRTIGRGAAVVLANSEYTARRFAVPGARAELRVVNYGIDDARFDPARIARADARGRLGLGEDEIVLAVVGQLTPWKGQDHAIRLVARLRSEHPGIRLVLAGSAKFTSRATRYDNLAYVRGLHALTEELDVRDRVSFVGERDDVPELLRAIDVALVPSWEEPFGRAVTEALAMEVPVVATEVGGPPEIVVDGVNGFVLPPTDLDRWQQTVSRLAADPVLRAEMGRRGRAHVRHAFSMRAYVEGVGAAYARAGCA